MSGTNDNLINFYRIIIIFFLSGSLHREVCVWGGVGVTVGLLCEYRRTLLISLGICKVNSTVMGAYRRVHAYRTDHTHFNDLIIKHYTRQLLIDHSGANLISPDSKSMTIVRE